MGSYLVTPRGGFVYHGSHMGRGNFVQHRSVVRQFCGGAVEELSLASQLGTGSLGSKPTHALGRPTSVLRLPLPQHVTLGRQSLIAGHFLSFPYSTCRKVSLNRSENLAAVPGDTASLARVP